MIKIVITFLLIFSLSQICVGQSPVYPITFSDRDEMDHWDEMMELPWRDSRPMVEVTYGYNVPRQKRFEGELRHRLAILLSDTGEHPRWMWYSWEKIRQVRYISETRRKPARKPD